MKYFTLIILLVCTIGMSNAQEPVMQPETPCFTKQKADSINAANILKLDAIVPAFIEWYVYEGQTEIYSGPPNVVSFVNIKIAESCPEE